MIVKIAGWSAMLVSLCIGLPLAAQEMSAETKARLCAERVTTLARLEQEAPQLRLERDALTRRILALASPDRVRNAELELQRWRRMHSTATTPEDRTLIEVQIWYWGYEQSYWGRSRPAGDPAAVQAIDRRLLDLYFAEQQTLSQRQTYVAGQILVLREGMESLGCAGVTTAGGTTAPPPPPVTTSTPPSGALPTRPLPSDPLAATKPPAAASGAGTTAQTQPATGSASARPIACTAICQPYCMGGMTFEAFTVWRSGPKPADLSQRCTSHCSKSFSGVTTTEGDTIGGINQCIRGMKQ